MKNTNTLKSYFQTGDYPTEDQFADLIDSCLNLAENDVITGLTDNGDNSYTFQVLSNGSTQNVVLDLGNLSGDIPIASIAGLTALLDGKVSQGGDTMTGVLTIAAGNGIPLRLAGTHSGHGNVSVVGFYESNGTTRQGYVGFGTGSSSDLILANDIGANSVRLLDDGGTNGLRYYYGGGNGRIWHSGNDGPGSGLDADTLDGVHATNFLRNHGVVTGATNWNGLTAPGIYFVANQVDDVNSPWTGAYNGNLMVMNSNGILSQLVNKGQSGANDWWVRTSTTNGSTWSSWAKLWTSTNDGPGSGLDADTLDGVQGTGFLRSDQTDTTTGNLYVNGNLDWRELGVKRTVASVEGKTYMAVAGASRFGVFGHHDGTTARYFELGNTHPRYYNGSSFSHIWHSGNDGSGSGLDADTLDGVHASVFVRNDGNAGTRFGGNYLQFNGDGASNNDYIAYNDATNAYYFNADRNRQNTAANAGIFAGTINAAGNVTATNFILSSDLRLKEKIQPLEKPISVDFVEFELKKSPGEKRYGVIAQELEHHHPELVHTDEEGMKQVKYIDLLVAKNAELEARIAKLERFIEKMQ